MCEPLIPDQGDILRISGMKVPVVVASNHFFNQSGKAVVCPIVPAAEDGPLHPEVDQAPLRGRILCEQVHYVDLHSRGFRKIGALPFFSVMDLSDAIMGIFDYQTV